LLESERWAHSLREERDKIFWTDRRVLYGRLLNAIDELVSAADELRFVELPEGEDSSIAEMRGTSPVVARYFTARDAFKALKNEVALIGDEAVVREVHGLDTSIDGISNLRNSHDGLVETMRSQLIGHGDPPGLVGSSRSNERSTNYAWWDEVSPSPPPR
jgi:hypothetical protein